MAIKHLAALGVRIIGATVAGEQMRCHRLLKS
jgi:hypothetical protein